VHPDALGAIEAARRAAEPPHAADSADSGEDSAALRAALEAMPEHRRVTLLLCYHDGMRHELAAEILGVPLGTLKSRLHAGLKELRTRLKSDLPSEVLA
jgi:RNA polymerase sigma-70 factor (ECF subfamily)